MGCLFCNQPEKSYKPSPDVEYICSSCVQLLLNADQEDKRRAYAKAIELGLTRKARALESFITKEGEEDERRRPETKRHERRANRKRSIRPVRDKAKRIRQVQA